MARPAASAPPWVQRRPVQTVTLDFDRPPGVNNLYLNIAGRGRIDAKPYREWKKLADVQIAIQRPGCVRGPFAIEIASERTSRRSDLDGILKATLDALQRAGVIQNDNLCQEIERVRWHGRGTSMRVRVTATKETWHEGN